jgi:L-histidine N-alpha-methyltransferase
MRDDVRIDDVRIEDTRAGDEAGVLDASRSTFAADVHRDLQLTPKQLQSKYLYDALGSHLFEAICQLPWYRITRAETRLLERYADGLVEPLGDPCTIVELGCGSGTKLATIAQALRRRGSPVLVHLIDISATALELSERTLRVFPHASIVGHRATYIEGLKRAAAARRGAMCVLFLGSNIGNLDMPAAAEFLRDVRGCLRAGDALLLGADLVKPAGELLLAYGDPLGVTAAFNKNLLERINCELDGNFDLAGFDHRPVWNAARSRIEMHLVSRRAQMVHIRLADLTVLFAPGEAIWTESSYKYTPESITELVTEAGFRSYQQWVDTDARFAVTLFIVA